MQTTRKYVHYDAADVAVKQQKQQQNPKEQVELEIDPIEFVSTTKSMLTTTMRISSLVNAMFRQFCNDFYGSTLTLNQYGNFDLTIYFVDRPLQHDGGPFKNIEPLIATPNTRGMATAQRLITMNHRISGRVYSLNDRTKSVLSKFYHLRPNQTINWKNIVTEMVDQQQFGGQQQILVAVHGLDIRLLLKAIYGRNNAHMLEGKRPNEFYDYNLMPVRPVGMSLGGNGGANYLVELTQLNTAEVEQLCKELGYVSFQGRLPINQA